MERKTKIELALAIAVLMIALACVLFWKQREIASVSSATQSQTITTAKAKPTTSVSVDGVPVPEPVVVKETSAITVARTFIERFGSYSSETDAANIEDVLSMATASFQKELQGIAKTARAATDGTYYGVSTLVVTAPKIVNASTTQTTLSMTTQRIEAQGDPENTTKKYQSITLTLVKSGTTWLVDGYTWKDGV